MKITYLNVHNFIILHKVWNEKINYRNLNPMILMYRYFITSTCDLGCSVANAEFIALFFLLKIELHT